MKKYLFSFAFVLVTLLFAGGLQFIRQKEVRAAESVVCFSDLGRRNSNQVSNVFPRNQQVYQQDAGCEQRNPLVMLSGYYDNSSLHTPSTQMNLFTIGSAPSVPQTVDVSILGAIGGTLFCQRDLSVTRVRVSDNAVLQTEFIPAITNGTVRLTFQANTFYQDPSLYGTNVWVSNEYLMVSVATPGQSASCKVDIGSWTGTFLAVKEVADPFSASGDPGNNGFNAANCSASGSCNVPPARQLVGPSRFGAGATALWLPNSVTNAAARPPTYSGAASTNPGYMEYGISFKPDCRVVTGQTRRIFLKFYDADNRTNSQSADPIFMALYDDTTNTTVPIYYTNGVPLTNNGELAFFGNDTYGEVMADIVGGHRYTWVWYNVRSNNGVQIYTPFSEIMNHGNVNCEPPNTAPSIDFELSCNSTGTVSFIRRRVQDGQAGTLSISGGYGNVNVAANTWANFNAPNFAGIRDGAPHSITLTVTDSGGFTGSATASYTCTIPAPTVTCTFVTPPGQRVSVGDNYYPVARVSSSNVVGAPTINAVVNITVNTVPAAARNTAAARGPISPGGSATFGAGSPPTVTYPSTPATGVAITREGPFTVSGSATWTATAGGHGGTVPCNGSGVGTTDGSAFFRPYFKVLGGDVINYGTGLIRGYNHQDLTFDPVAATCTLAIRCGAGVEGAIQTGGTIGGVPSRYKQATSGGAKGLTYANTLTGTYSTYGGGFGGPAVSKTYTAPTGAPNFPAFAAIPAGTNQEYTTNSPNLPGGTLRAGARVTLYATGNVRITGNILYEGSGNYGASADNIPHFRLIANGHIFVDPSVTQLDGEYISMQNVYSCHNGTWNVPIPTTPSIFGTCSTNTLIVNGALIGDSIRLTRMRGHIRGALVTDGFTSTCAAGSVTTRGYCNDGNIAEIIQFTPELFLSRPATSPQNEVNTGRYESITALPPLF